MDGYFMVGIYIENGYIYSGITDFNNNMLEYSVDRIDYVSSLNQAIASIKSSIYNIIKKMEIEIDDILGIGVGFPGPVDLTTGRIVNAPNMRFDWSNTDLEKILKDEFRKPVAIDNNAKAFLFGEWIRGQGINYDNIVCLLVGRGIGGSVMSDGNILYGKNGFMGEFGHMVMSISSKDTLESYASIEAIVKTAKKNILYHTDSKIWTNAGKDISKIDFDLIMDAYKNGDVFAIEIIRNAINYLSLGLANIITILNPHLVIIGGKITEYKEELLESIVLTTKQNITLFPSDNVKIVFSELGMEAGIIGTSGLAKITMAVRRRERGDVFYDENMVNLSDLD